jgi:hypothetical protein
MPSWVKNQATAPGSDKVNNHFASLPSLCTSSDGRKPLSATTFSTCRARARCRHGPSAFAHLYGLALLGRVDVLLVTLVRRDDVRELAGRLGAIAIDRGAGNAEVFVRRGRIRRGSQGVGDNGVGHAAHLAANFCAQRSRGGARGIRAGKSRQGPPVAACLALPRFSTRRERAN